MRQGQQNRRGRGRPNNSGRSGKGQNPLTRSQESNGPDVKIRGTASHIAEKYISLARDSLSSGDIVMAENYLQHAEHYNRIIMTYREQTQPQGDNGPGNNNNGHSRRGDGGRQAEGRQGEPHFSSRGGEGGSDAAETGAYVEPAIRGTEPQPNMTEHQPVKTRAAGHGVKDEGRSRRPQRGVRSARNKVAGNGEDPSRGNAPSRRRGSSDNSQSGAGARKSGGSKIPEGSRISDGQEAPGFLRNSVAPTRRRARSDAEPEPAVPAVAPVGDEDGA